MPPSAPRRGSRRSTSQRLAQGQRTTDFYLALHCGDLLFGNFGSANRLDFTVLGPAVNEASRIGGMCRSLDQRVIVSSAFAEGAGPRRARPGLARPLRAARRRPAAGTLHHRPQRAASHNRILYFILFEIWP